MNCPTTYLGGLLPWLHTNSGDFETLRISLLDPSWTVPRQLNGFSNMFWGWGGEDDDMAARVQSKGDQFNISNTDQTNQTISNKSDQQERRYANREVQCRDCEVQDDQTPAGETKQDALVLAQNKLKEVSLNSFLKRLIWEPAKYEKSCRFSTDGLTSVDYKVVERKSEPLFSEVQVHLGKTKGDVRGHQHIFQRLRS